MDRGAAAEDGLCESPEKPPRASQQELNEQASAQIAVLSVDHEDSKVLVLFALGEALIVQVGVRLP